MTSKYLCSYGHTWEAKSLTSMQQTITDMNLTFCKYFCFAVINIYCAWFISDVKGLKEPSIICEYQDSISEALLVYSITHYPKSPNKHCEMMARLAELTRTCNLGKDQLSMRQAAGEVPQFSLLSELLKGDIVVQAAE